MSKRSIWTIDRTLSDATTSKGYSAFPKAPALLEPRNQIVKCHSQGTSWGGYYPSAEMHSVYSTTPADWASLIGLVTWDNITVYKLSEYLIS